MSGGWNTDTECRRGTRRDAISPSTSVSTELRVPAPRPEPGPAVRGREEEKRGEESCYFPVYWRPGSAVQWWVVAQ